MQELYNVTYSDVIDLILEQNIVSIFQGKSEGGPRALGNRSILFDPRNPNAKDIVNKVKNREWYRPFAGTILLEYANDWFDMRGLKESPFMMYAMNAWEDKEKYIPGIIHVDGTCRIQTVTEEQNCHYYNLIKCFFEKTEVPILFNTSFNLGGRVLVQTIYDAYETLQQSMIEYMYVPEENKLVIIKN
jgi:carbamoyltransferase